MHVKCARIRLCYHEGIPLELAEHVANADELLIKDFFSYVQQTINLWIAGRIENFQPLFPCHNEIAGAQDGELLRQLLCSTLG